MFRLVVEGMMNVLRVCKEVYVKWVVMIFLIGVVYMNFSI